VRRDWTAARAKVEREANCRICGAAWKIEAAHIIPRSLGGGQSEDAIVPLCPDHHREYDSHRLDLLPHLTHDEQAEAVRVLGLERARRRLSPEAA
jgi:5-methylcytosine-specific restriction endonuclease McrA